MVNRSWFGSPHSDSWEAHCKKPVLICKRLFTRLIVDTYSNTAQFGEVQLCADHKTVLDTAITCSMNMLSGAGWNSTLMHGVTHKCQSHLNLSKTKVVRKKGL